jgi:hypothetical protein
MRVTLPAMRVTLPALMAITAGFLKDRPSYIIRNNSEFVGKSVGSRNKPKRKHPQGKRRQH